MVYCALNTISVELEEPFGTDANDVDIEIRHEDFLWLLVDVLRAPKTTPQTDDYALEESILRGVARGCPIIAPELAAYAPPPEDDPFAEEEEEEEEEDSADGDIFRSTS